MQEYNVSVIVAVYNGEKYLENQLSSLLDQSIKISQVIITDDGSTDQSMEIIEKFIIDHELSDTWTLKKTETNLGPAANFINMCKETTGDYIFFCDQDDIWMPDKIEKMCGIINDDPAVNLLYADVIDTGDPESCPSFDSNLYDGSVERIEFSPENYFFKGLGCATCITRAFMRKVIRYWTAGWEHDMFFWACAILTDSGYRYNRPVIWRRIHSDNVSMHEVKTLEKRTAQVEKSLKRPKRMKRMLRDFDINDPDKAAFLAQYYKVLAKRDRALKHRDPFLALDVLITGRQYFLHKAKGAILDLVLILFKKYSL